jgi:hypothetical protein
MQKHNIHSTLEIATVGIGEHVTVPFEPESREKQVMHELDTVACTA